MKYKVNVWKLLGKIAAMLIALIVIFYAFNVGGVVGNRVDIALDGSTWISVSERIVFVGGGQGTLQKSISTTQQPFTYELGNGYVLCFDEEDSLLLELVQIKDDRMFSVQSNTVFYNEAVYL